jgi:hypothetical protein
MHSSSESKMKRLNHERLPGIQVWRRRDGVLLLSAGDHHRLIAQEEHAAPCCAMRAQCCTLGACYQDQWARRIVSKRQDRRIIGIENPSSAWRRHQQRNT